MSSGARESIVQSATAAEQALEKFVRITAPVNLPDFVFKLCVLVLISGSFNHIRDLIQHGFDAQNVFLKNLIDAAYTAVPMCIFALLLIGHLNALQKRLYRQATEDSLTGLQNRRWFMDKIAARTVRGTAVFIIDVDHFKVINDTYGHDVGDSCLQRLASHLRSSVRKTDDCARIGGEEFAVLINDANHQRVCDIADRISKGFVFEVGAGQSHHVTSSVGVVFCHDGQQPKEALKRADEAVYRAKALGRARYVIAPTHDEATALAGNLIQA